MQMTGSNGILTIPDEHVPGLVALVVFPLVAWCVVALVRAGAVRGLRPAVAVQARLDALPFVSRAALVGMLVGAVVHAAIVPTHWGDSRVLALLFIADAVGFVAASAWLLVGGRHWRLAAVAMLAGTVGGYVLYLLLGWETADPVGLATTGIELTAALMLVMPVRSSSWNRSRRQILWTSIPVAAATLAGTVLLVGGPTASAVKAGAADRQPMPAMSGNPHDPLGAMGSGSAGSLGSSGSMPGMGSAEDPAAAPGTDGMSSGSMPGMTGSGGSSGMPAVAASGMPPMTSPSSPGSGGSGSMPGMPGMPGGGQGSSGPSLSLPTTSPAGPITWPATMGAMGTGMQMVTPDCTTAPTASQQQAAVSLVDQTVAATQRYQSLANAEADGYVPITPSGRPVVHYAKPAYIDDGQLLDPGAVESLVYANTPHGAVLVAAMYLMANNQVGAKPPMPGGCLTEWHIHTNLCFSDANGTVVGVTNGGTCPAGSANHVSQPMIHVWLAPVPGGPLVVDGSDSQVVQAAEKLPVPSPPNGTA